VGAVVVVGLMLVVEVEALAQMRENTNCYCLCYHTVSGKWRCVSLQQTGMMEVEHEVREVLAETDGVGSYPALAFDVVKEVVSPRASVGFPRSAFVAGRREAVILEDLDLGILRYGGNLFGEQFLFALLRLVAVSNCGSKGDLETYYPCESDSQSLGPQLLCMLQDPDSMNGTS
jgi:hypothetical protein